MKRRYILYRRKRGGMFYIEDTETDPFRAALHNLLASGTAICRFSETELCLAQQSNF